MNNFYLKFNSEHEDVDFNNAVSIDGLAELLKSLYTAIYASKKDNVVLSQVTDNCYQLGFKTSNDVLELRCIEANNDILEKSDRELSPGVLRYKKAVDKVIKENWYLEILNSEGVPVVKIPHGFSQKSVDHYYSNKSFVGYITLIGDRELDPKSLHIYLSEHKNIKIFISENQHKELTSYYRKNKIRAKVKLKKSLSSNRVMSAKLLSFKVKSTLNFPENLDQMDLSDLNFEID